MRRFLLAMALVFGLVLVAVPAGAQTDYEGGAQLTSSPPTIDLGGSTTVTGTGFTPGATVTVTLNGSTFTTVVADADGRIQFTYQPSDLPANGVALFTATDGVRTASTQVTVLAPGAAPVQTTAGDLPRTGTDSGSLVRLAFVAIALGGVFLIASRRRRDEHDTIDRDRDLTPTG